MPILSTTDVMPELEQLPRPTDWRLWRLVTPRCTECGHPHENVATKWRTDGSILQTSWADPVDGHVYNRESGDVQLQRLAQRIIELENGAA